jgi:NAD(P)-dependent dehydrogenase (short-subunit alcohol dehydrogenase family)
VSAAARWALVTGATRGIGRAVTERLLAHGRSVIACARDEGALARLEAAYPGRVVPVALDLEETGAVDVLVERTLDRAPAVSELVCSAGIVRYAPIGAVAEADLRAQLEVNFVAPFRLAERLGVHMRARGGGAVVLVASTLGLRAAPSTAAYAASKAALISAGRSLALELAPEVRCNVVAPGVVDTDMIRVSRTAEPATPETLAAQMAALTALHPLGRLGRPEEVAEAVTFLLDAAWITGSVLTVDGGLTAA